MKSTGEAETIRWLLRELGGTETYVGFNYTVYAVQLCLSDPGRLTQLTDQIYMDTATQYKTNWKAVVRNIRTLASVAWNRNPTLLSKLSEYPVTRKPNNGRFLSILTVAVRERSRGVQKMKLVKADSIFPRRSEGA